jgi:DNA-binding XRE family transcriptional regulator
MRVPTAVVEIAILAMFHPWQYLTLRCAVALQLIRNNYPWYGLQALEQLGAERVRRCRMALRLNQTTFADKVGIPVPTLSSIEHGHQSIYAERVVQLAESWTMPLELGR